MKIGYFCNTTNWTKKTYTKILDEARDIAGYCDGGGHKFAAGARITNMGTVDIAKTITNKLANKIDGEF